MKIIVCAKQVPASENVRFDPATGVLIRDGVPSILNPDDAHALEAALTLKDKDPNTSVSVVSMGPAQAAYMLRECMAMGADEAVLLSDRAFAGADAFSTSATLAAGIQKMGEYDLILAGRQASDGDTAQVGPQVAMRLGIPAVTCVSRIEYKGDSLRVRRMAEDGCETIDVQLPCLLTAVPELNEPRYMTVRGIQEAYERDITVWNHVDLNLEPEDCGLDASPTQVLRSIVPPQPVKGKRLSGTPAEIADGLVKALKELKLL